MDSNGDGIVTKSEIMDAVMSDVEWDKYMDGKLEAVVGTIEKMIEKHDKNKNGFDFLEMYAAGGGRLQDL